MALDKNGVQNAVSRYSGVLDNAKTSCDNALAELIKTRDKIAQNWQSASSDAMVQGLDELYEKLFALSSEIESLKGQLQTEGNNICANWTEKEEKVEDKDGFTSGFGGEGSFGSGNGGGGIR